MELYTFQVGDATEDDIRYHYRKARELFASGQLPEMRQLINLHLELVVVFKEHVEIFIHVLPSFCGINHNVFHNIQEKKMEIPSLQKTEITRGLIIHNYR